MGLTPTERGVRGFCPSNSGRMAVRGQKGLPLPPGAGIELTRELSS